MPAFTSTASGYVSTAAETALVHLAATEDLTAIRVLFGSTGTHLCHALQYPIGAATHTPHGLGVGLLLPYALVAARGAIEDRLAALAGVCGLDVSGASESEAAGEFLDWLVGLLADIGIPATLADIGVDRADLPRFAEMGSGVTRLVQNHPGPTDTAALTAILEAA